MRKLIGRKPEKEILKKALNSNRPELVVVYGRRRIGKTYLVREVYKKSIVFEFSGMYNSPMSDQLKKFYRILLKKTPNIKEPIDWIEAFDLLSDYFDRFTSTNKRVIFIDEFPWLDTPDSNFHSAFDNFWNSYATKKNNIVIVICGSAASYMINNIINSKGGLHNRFTQSIQLEPFDLFETEQLLKNNNVKLTRYDILQIYMAMGGVPHYLEKIEPGESVTQAIDRLCFQKNGFLRKEFTNVFQSLFDNHENHEAIIRSLANTRKGLTRNEISSKSNVGSGGTLSKTLKELVQSGFIEKYFPYQGSKDSIYRLSDEYSMFYIKFIEKTRPTKDGDIWVKLQVKQSFKSWSGYSFETICMKHIDQIKQGLKISGINSDHGSWIEKGKGGGAQIDMLIDRDDNVINLCEMKFYNTEFTLDKKYAFEIAKKANKFSESTKTKKSIFVTFITTYGLVSNQYSKQYVQNELTMEHLFIDI